MSTTTERVTMGDRMLDIANGETPRAITAKPPANRPPVMTMSTASDEDELQLHALFCTPQTLDALHQMVPGLDTAPPDEKLARLVQHFASGGKAGR